MFRLKVTQQEEIITLKARGWSARRIARELGCDRDTVRRYLRAGETKPATLTPGSPRENGPESLPRLSGLPAESATLTPGSSGAPVTAGETIIETEAAARANVSLCERSKLQIEAGLDQQLSAKRIHQDLVREHGFAGSYQSVKRFVRKLEFEAPVPYRRMDFAPGEQVQVDFGQGAWVVDENGKRLVNGRTFSARC